jgi:hypothetical protein
MPRAHRAHKQPLLETPPTLTAGITQPHGFAYKYKYKYMVSHSNNRSSGSNQTHVRTRAEITHLAQRLPLP